MNRHGSEVPFFDRVCFVTREGASEIRRGGVVGVGESRTTAKYHAVSTCDDWPERADYRMNLAGTGIDIAVNIRKTGARVYWDSGSAWVRCQVEVLDDDEPSTFAKGWLRVR